jgi:hypothetical protein
VEIQEGTAERNGVIVPLLDPVESKERRNLLICILASLFSIQTVNMNVTTIVPNFCAEKHKSLKELEIAFIMT